MLNRSIIVYINWFKSYDTNEKNLQNRKNHKNHYIYEVFYTKSQKPGDGNICVLCHNFWSNQGIDPFSTSKWQSEPQFLNNIYVDGDKLAINGHKMAICQSQIFVISLYNSLNLPWEKCLSIWVTDLFSQFLRGETVLIQDTG